MTIQQRILRRKIGVFELLTGAIPFELVFGSTARTLLLAALAAGFYFAKKEFGGEFSLLDAMGLFTKQTEAKGDQRQ